MHVNIYYRSILCLCLFVYLFMYVCMYLSIYLSIYIYIYLYICIYISLGLISLILNLSVLVYHATLRLLFTNSIGHSHIYSLCSFEFQIPLKEYFLPFNFIQSLKKP